MNPPAAIATVSQQHEAVGKQSLNQQVLTEWLKSITVNNCWKNKSNVVNLFQGFSEINKVKKTTEVAREISGEWFVNMLEEVEASIESHWEMLTNEKLKNL